MINPVGYGLTNDHVGARHQFHSLSQCIQKFFLTAFLHFKADFDFRCKYRQGMLIKLCTTCASGRCNDLGLFKEDFFNHQRNLIGLFKRRARYGGGHYGEAAFIEIRKKRPARHSKAYQGDD